MGLFKKIKRKAKKAVRKTVHAVKHPVTTVKSTAHKIVTNPARYTFAIGTGGVSELVRKAPVVGKFQRVGEQAYSALQVAVADRYTYGLASVGQSLAATATAPKGQGGSMGFNVGGFLGAAGQILGSVQGGNAGAVRGVGAVSSILGAGFSKPATASAMTPARISATPAMAVRPQLPRDMGQGAKGLGAMGAVVGRSFFNKYPNLAAAIQRFRNAGMKQVTRSRLYGLLKRFGPDLLITGGILTAAAVSELMMAGPGYRRMNPANIHALRRAKRRLESFHRVCMDVDSLRRPRRSSCKTKGGGAANFVRQG